MAWSNTVHLNIYQLFLDKSKPSKTKNATDRLKQDKSQFIQLLLSSQSGREIDKKEVFSYENCDYPPSLCQNGKMYSGTKSELLRCIEEDINIIDTVPSADVVVIVGSLMIRLLKPETSVTFKDYAEDIVLPYLQSWLQNVSRIDIVWDEYFEDSLKTACREARGKGLRRHVTLATKIPKNFPAFLRDEENKKELFALLASYIESMMPSQGKEIYTTHGPLVLTSHTCRNLTPLTPYNHEEVDTRALLHVADATHHNFRKIMIHANDIDSVVIAISCIQDLNIE